MVTVTLRKVHLSLSLTVEATVEIILKNLAKFKGKTAVKGGLF